MLILILKYKYYGHGSYSHPSGGNGRNVIIFGVDMNSSTKTDNRKKDILILSLGPTQGLEHTVSAEKINSIFFSESDKRFCLNLHDNGANSYLFVNATEMLQQLHYVKRHISKEWAVDNMKKTGLNDYVFGFSVDYDAIAVDDVLEIHKYLMEKNNMIQECLGLFKKWFLQD